MSCPCSSVGGQTESCPSPLQSVGLQSAFVLAFVAGLQSAFILAFVASLQSAFATDLQSASVFTTERRYLRHRPPGRFCLCHRPLKHLCLRRPPPEYHSLRPCRQPPECLSLPLHSPIIGWTLAPLPNLLRLPGFVWTPVCVCVFPTVHDRSLYLSATVFVCICPCLLFTPAPAHVPASFKSPYGMFWF